MKKKIDKKELSKKSFNNQASSYDFDKNGAHARKQYDYILKKIKKLDFSSVLDVGCGTGEIIKSITINYPDINCCGLDISENMIEKAREKLENKANLSIGDSENLPYENDKFDLILCNDSFHHYTNPQKAIKEFYRVLKPRGYLLLSDYYKSFFIRTMMNLFISYSKDGDVKIYSIKEIEKILNNSNFKVMDIDILNCSMFFLARK